MSVICHLPVTFLICGCPAAGSGRNRVSVASLAGQILCYPTPNEKQVKGRKKQKAFDLGTLFSSLIMTLHNHISRYAE
jgi:hypothetical protein